MYITANYILGSPNEIIIATCKSVATDKSIPASGLFTGYLLLCCSSHCLCHSPYVMDRDGVEWVACTND